MLGSSYESVRKFENKQNELLDEKDSQIKKNSIPNPLLDLSNDQIDTSEKNSKTYKMGSTLTIKPFLADFREEDEGHSESYIELKRAIVECSGILKALEGGSFSWTSENYNDFNRLFEAATRYVNDHLGAKSTDGKRRLDSAINIKLKLYNISNTILKKEGINTDVMVEGAAPDEVAVARANVKRLIKYYRAYCKRIGNDIMGSDEEKIRRRWDVLKSCEQDILLYLRSKHNKKLSTDAAFLKAEYLSLRNMVMLRNLAKQKGEKTAFSNSYLTTIDEHEQELDRNKIEDKKDSIVDQEDGLSKQQVAALSKIDTWVVRNFRNGGYMSMFGSACDRTDIIGRLFSMSRRKRMYIYYLIETKQRLAPTAEGLICSQLEYKPNISIFKDRMIAHKLKFYSRFSGGYIYWNKLTEAIAIAEQASPVIVDMQKFLMEEEKESKKNKKKNNKNNIIEKDDDSKNLIEIKKDDEDSKSIIDIKKDDEDSKSILDIKKDDEDPKNALEIKKDDKAIHNIIITENKEIDLEKIDDMSMEELKSVEDELNKSLIRSSISAIRLLQRNSTNSDLPGLSGNEDILVKSFGKNAGEIAEALNRVRRAINDKRATQAKKGPDVKQYVSQLPNDLSGLAGALQLGLGNVIYNRLTEGVPMLNIDFKALIDGDYKNVFSKGSLNPSEAQIKDMKEYYKGSTQLLKLLGNVVGMYFLIKSYNENYDAMNQGDVLSNVSDMTMTAAKTVQNFAKIMGVFYECGFVDFVTHDATYATMGVIDTAIAGVKAATHYRNSGYRKNASKLAAAKTNKDKFTKGMLKLDRKLGWKQKTDTLTSVSTAGGSAAVSVLIAMSIISAAAAPVALGIVGAACFGVSIVKRTISSRLSKGMKMELFDNFFKVDDAVGKVKTEWRRKHPGQRMTEDQESRLVNQVRRRIAADLGFYSPTHASKALAVEYANYLLENSKNGKANKDMCRNFIQGLGLQYKYDEENDEILVPKQSDIVKKLCG